MSECDVSPLGVFALYLSDEETGFSSTLQRCLSRLLALPKLPVNPYHPLIQYLSAESHFDPVPATSTHPGSDNYDTGWGALVQDDDDGLLDDLLGEDDVDLMDPRGRGKGASGLYDRARQDGEWDLNGRSRRQWRRKCRNLWVDFSDTEVLESQDVTDPVVIIDEDTRLCHTESFPLFGFGLPHLLRLCPRNGLKVLRLLLLQSLPIEFFNPPDSVLVKARSRSRSKSSRDPMRRSSDERRRNARGEGQGETSQQNFGSNSVSSFGSSGRGRGERGGEGGQREASSSGQDDSEMDEENEEDGFGNFARRKRERRRRKKRRQGRLRKREGSQSQSESELSGNEGSQSLGSRSGSRASSDRGGGRIQKRNEAGAGAEDETTGVEEERVNTYTITPLCSVQNGAALWNPRLCPDLPPIEIRCDLLVRGPDLEEAADLAADWILTEIESIAGMPVHHVRGLHLRPPEWATETSFASSTRRELKSDWTRRGAHTAKEKDSNINNSNNNNNNNNNNNDDDIHFMGYDLRSNFGFRHALRHALEFTIENGGMWLSPDELGLAHVLHQAGQMAVGAREGGGGEGSGRR
eukprot:CAMPEP_0175047826 /NCGR_PEP_ID=MMETSP0052_2-20121109/5825_1 /TAXON_ID=51329 ORGANISM="Polytomella parva, Strain SAG 63-3" /NCGR_SAMPLE_ID=MMETSP0052_2 /ASSEMBLY_ACC=CAM_ASM_000194 /LENGTH=579 /DNA_ID=CAMNT_0016311773 /DNA_START=28 /DNA_END=1764 /DNA_ORIENTATION=-